MRRRFQFLAQGEDGPSAAEVEISRVPIGLGRLPGDIVVERHGCTFYFPLATGLAVGLFQPRALAAEALSGSVLQRTRTRRGSKEGR